jgi:hypothetical protein
MAEKADQYQLCAAPVFAGFQLSAINRVFRMPRIWPRHIQTVSEPIQGNNDSIIGAALNQNCLLDLFFGATANMSQPKTWPRHPQLSPGRDYLQDQVKYITIALPQTPKLRLVHNR